MTLRVCGGLSYLKDGRNWDARVACFWSFLRTRYLVLTPQLTCRGVMFLENDVVGEMLLLVFSFRCIVFVCGSGVPFVAVGDTSIDPGLGWRQRWTVREVSVMWQHNDYVVTVADRFWLVNLSVLVVLRVEPFLQFTKTSRKVESQLFPKKSVRQLGRPLVVPWSKGISPSPVI